MDKTWGQVAQCAAARLLVVSTVLTLLVACGFGAPDPQQQLRDSFAALREASAVELAGEVALAGERFTFDLSVGGQGGSVTGGLNDGDISVQVLRAGGHLFLSSQQYFLRQAEHVGSMWVLDAGDKKVAPLVERLVDLRAFTSSVEKSAGKLSETDGKPAAGGQKTFVLSGPQLTVTVASGKNPRPLHIETKGDHQLDGQLSALKLDLHYGSPPQVKVPTTYVDVSNPESLPVYLTYTDPDPPVFDECDLGGCNLSAGLKNLGGGYGAAGVTFTLDQGGPQLGSCNLVVPPLAHGASTRVGCRADAQLADATVHGVVELDNNVA